MVRTFQKTDLDAMGEIWLEANLDAHGFIPQRYWEAHLELVKALLPQAEVFVVQREDGQVQGFLGLEGDYIAGLFIRRGSRSCGFGKMLLDAAKNVRDHLSLNVYQKNNRAAAFYLREGFAIQHEGLDRETREPDYRMVWSKAR